MSTSAMARRDDLLALLEVHDLHLAPLDRLNGAERWQHHPDMAERKWRLECAFVEDLERRDAAQGWDLPDDDAVATLRAIAARDLVPDVYRWLADEATLDELVEFLALEGGPDGGFDDLVAICQIGLGGQAKLELARNYWDEMGRGSHGDVHTELHAQLVRALDLPVIPREDHPVEALERAAFGSLLATNRWLQPEMVGALGLIELQAGPRCRKVVEGLRRVGAPEGALPFYEEHAVADPRHGKGWVDNVVGPLADDRGWGSRIVKGARWRSVVNERFFTAMHRRFAGARAIAS